MDRIQHIQTNRKVNKSIGAKLISIFRTLVYFIVNLLRKVLKKVVSLFSKKSSPENVGDYSQHGASRSRRTPSWIPSSPVIPGILIVTVLLIVLGAVVLGRNDDGTASTKNNSDKIKVKGAKATQEINKEFTFPLKDGEGEEVSRIKYEIAEAELRDEIIVKGQKAIAVEGREFLIIGLKITNEYKSDIEMRSRDYIRLVVDGDEDEFLAPEIHNDPVEVQAISTKYTRVGFPIDTDTKELKLRVGEIGGDKEEIELDLKK